MEVKHEYAKKARNPFWLNLESIRLNSEEAKLTLTFRDGFPRFVISKSVKTSGSYMDNNIFIRMDGINLVMLSMAIRDVANNLKNNEKLVCLYGYDNAGNKVEVNVVDGTILIRRGDDGIVRLEFTHYNEKFVFQLRPDKDWFRYESNGIDVTDKSTTSKRYALAYAFILESIVGDATVATSNSYNNTK